MNWFWSRTHCDEFIFIDWGFILRNKIPSLKAPFKLNSFASARITIPVKNVLLQNLRKHDEKKHSLSFLKKNVSTILKKIHKILMNDKFLFSDFDESNDLLNLSKFTNFSHFQILWGSLTQTTIEFQFFDRSQYVSYQPGVRKRKRYYHRTEQSTPKCSPDLHLAKDT